MTTSGLLLQAEHLACTYRNGTRAVKDFGLELREGDLVGLIGPDGAGKTTTFRMLMGLQTPTSGTLRILVDPDQVAYMPQVFALAPDLTVAENMRFQAGLYGIKNPAARISGLLASVDLERFRDRMSGALSGGMKHKLSLCVALLPRPRLLLLDEPTTGVDPVSRREFWALLHDVHDEGVAILFTSPYMDEAEYAHDMLLMHEGNVLDQGSLPEFRAKIPGVTGTPAGNALEVAAELVGAELVGAELVGPVPAAAGSGLEVFFPTGTRLVARKHGVVDQAGECLRFEFVTQHRIGHRRNLPEHSFERLPA